LQAEPLYGIVPLGKGARAQGPRSSLRLNQPCRRFITNTKEHNHGHEEEEEKEEIEVNDVERKPRIGAAPSTSDFARSLISSSDRTKVRSLLFSVNDFPTEPRFARFCFRRQELNVDYA